MEAFDFVSAKSIDEAVSILNEHGDRARIIAGGTDILVMMRAGRRLADVVVDVKEIPELNQMTMNAEGGLTLGAAVPCYLIYQDQAIASAYPGLIDSATLIGGIQIQGRATIGGNLCNAAPSGDSIPAVIALSGVCHIAGPNGTRQLPAEESLHRTRPERAPAGRIAGGHRISRSGCQLRSQLPAVHSPQ